MKAYLIGGLVLALLTTGAGWWHSTSERLKAEGRAEALVARADSVHRAALDSLAARDSLAVQEIRAQEAEQRRLEAARAAAEARAAREASRAAEALRRLRAATEGDTTATAALDSLVNAHAEQVRALEDQVAAVTGLHEAERAVSAQLRGQLTEARSVIDVQKSLIAALRQQVGASRTGFAETWGGRALAFGVGVGVGAVGMALAGG